PVRAPTRRGFGTTVIERSIPFDLNGEASVQYNLAGVSAEFVIPANYVQVPQVPLASSHPPRPGIQSMSGARVSGRALLVEDNMIIALDAEASLERLGANFVDVAPNVSEALRLIEKNKPDFAILDVNLGNESSFPIADRLSALGIPIVFATGYGRNIEFPDRFKNIPVVSKPYTADVLAPKLAEALAQRS
ncbi:MAG TPA: response regulator, partial [Rhizomicrobium sp.]|nr:response regulator [Rhizomicrobium sp.]